jgi:glycosyltransferase involved in cell wall biosynthesis
MAAAEQQYGFMALGTAGGLELQYPARLVQPSAWVGHLPFALWLVGALKPRMVVELGVHTGNSYCAFLQAVHALGLDTRCFGIDHWQGDPHAGHYDDEVYHELRAYHDPLYGTFSTLLRSSFEEAVHYFSDSSVDLLHIDGFHTYEAVSADFQAWLPKVSSHGVALFHDTNVRERGFGIWRFWEELTSRYPHFEFSHSHGLGIVYLGSEPLTGPLKALFEARTASERESIQNYFARLGISVAERLATETLAAEIDTLKTQARPLEAGLTEARSKLEKAEAELSTARSKLEKAETELSTARSKLAEADKARATVNALEAELAAVRSDLAKARTDAAILASDLNARLQNLNLQLSEANAKAALSAELEVPYTEFVELCRQHATLKSSMTARGRELAVTLKELAYREDDKLAFARDLALTRARTAELERAHAELELRMEKTCSELAGRETEILQREAERTALLTQIEALYASSSWKFARPLRVLKRSAANLHRTATALLGRAKVEQAEAQTDESAASLEVEITSPTELEILAPSDLERVRAAFDQTYYLARYPDIQASGVDPFEHYMLIGWREGRDPSPDFSTTFYLMHSSDIAAAGMNPFVHWVLHGIEEKRQALSFHHRITSKEYAPKVSAIVPNYNHARFLSRRIESILRQTYRNLEILILDDCSSDESRAVIDLYCQDYPDRIRAIFNEKNSGNVFRQWRKGIDNSDGQVIWICESDDFCEPNFLEKLIPHFRNESVNIAFGRIQETDAEGNVGDLDYYREAAEPGIWEHSLVRPARQWFANAFGVNNVIANVGGCIWRRAEILDSVWREAQTFSVVGDWYLYCHVAGGGQIVWEPEAVSYFRRHATSTSGSSFVRPAFYQELERFMMGLRRQWDVPDETVEKFYQKVVWQYTRTFDLEGSLGPLEKYCDKRKILAQHRTRPHILMAFYGFIFGGGELFPVALANHLHADGWRVSMLAFETGSTNSEMRAALNPAIPVYDSTWVTEYGADRFIAEAGISLVHSHTLGSELWFFEYWKITAKIPYLVTLHGSYEATNRAHLPDERIATLVSGVSHFVYTADKNLKLFDFLALPRSIFTKLPNAMPVDPLPFPKTREDLGIASDAVVYTLVARGIPEKGWEASIEAFVRLREKHPERALHLLLCGEGDEPDRLFALHGTDPDITFLGFQTRVHGLYRLSDVAIVPSRFSGESYPLCIIQAFQTGTPVIGSRVGEIKTMLAPPDQMPAGVLIEPSQDDDLFIRSLEGAMEIMLSEARRNEYAEAARILGESYSMDRLVGVYADLYDSLLAETRDGALRESTAAA